MKLKKFVAVLSSPLCKSSMQVSFCSVSEASAFRYLKSFGSFTVDVLDDVTDRYPISLTKLALALNDSSFDDTEIAFICDALERTGVGSFELPD